MVHERPPNMAVVQLRNLSTSLPPSARTNWPHEGLSFAESSAMSTLDSTTHLYNPSIENFQNFKLHTFVDVAR